MGMLRIDWNVIATVVNLIVLYLLMRRFLFRPIMNIMDQRKQMIDSKFTEAKDVQSRADQMKEEYMDLLSNAKEESQKIVEQARETAKADYESKIDSANTQVNKMLETAREKIEMERQKTLHDLESQISSLAMCAAGKVIGRNASAKYDEALYDQFLSEAGEPNDTDR